MEKWKVVYSTDDGFYETHSDDMTYDEAVERCTDLSECFPHMSYHVEPYDHNEKVYNERKDRVYSNNAVDGWNDLYPSTEDDEY